jgi:hypothetical protein
MHSDLITPLVRRLAGGNGMGRLYDRTGDEITLDEVERIAI